MLFCFVFCSVVMCDNMIGHDMIRCIWKTTRNFNSWCISDCIILFLDACITASMWIWFLSSELWHFLSHDALWIDIVRPCPVMTCGCARLDCSNLALAQGSQQWLMVVCFGVRKVCNLMTMHWALCPGLNRWFQFVFTFFCFHNVAACLTLKKAYFQIRETTNGVFGPGPLCRWAMLWSPSDVKLTC